MKKRSLSWYLKVLAALLAANMFVAGLYQFLIKPYFIVQPADPLDTARIAFGKGDNGRAEVLVRNILATMPENVEAHVFLGSLLAASNRWSEAAASYERGLSIEPTHRLALHGCDFVYAKLRQPERAVEAWRRAAKMKNEDPELWKSLGYAQVRSGDSMGAMFSLRRSLRLDPKQDEVRRVFHEISMSQRPGAALARQGQDHTSSLGIPGFPDLPGKPGLHPGDFGSPGDGRGNYGPGNPDPVRALPGIQDPLRGLQRPGERMR